MRARELVPILAEHFGIVGDAAFAIDRALADHGLREMSKGRARPDATRPEGLTFLIGCMIYLTMRHSSAGRIRDDVAMWVNATTYINCGVAEDDPYVEELIAQGLPLAEALERARKDHISEFPFREGLEGKFVTLIDYLLAVMHYRQDSEGVDDFDDIVFKISPSHYEATVTVRSKESFASHTETFIPREAPASVFDRPPLIKSMVSVEALALAEISARTVDPLEKPEGGA